MPSGASLRYSSSCPETTEMMDGPGCVCQPVCPPGLITFCTTYTSESPLVANSTLLMSLWVLTLTSASEVGPPMMVVEILLPGVARADRRAIAVNPQARRTTANDSLDFLYRMVLFLFGTWV